METPPKDHTQTTLEGVITILDREIAAQRRANTKLRAWLSKHLPPSIVAAIPRASDNDAADRSRSSPSE